MCDIIEPVDIKVKSTGFIISGKEEEKMFSNRDLIKIIIPVLIEVTLTRVIGIVDSAMVAHAGEAAVSGVSLVDSVNLLFMYTFTALASGGAVVISQTIGAKKSQLACEGAKQLFWLVTAVGFVLSVVLLVFHKDVLRMIFGSVEKSVMDSACDYFFYTLIGFTFLSISSACSAIFRAMGDTKRGMKVSLITNIINVCGNAILIFGFKLGAAGAAISTSVSYVVGACIMFVAVSKRTNEVYIDKVYSYKPDWRLVRRICAIGIPNGLENCMFQFGKVITQSLVSGLGTVSIAANAVANTLTSLQYIPGNTTNVSTVPVVGRCVGAGENEQAKKNAFKLVAITYIMLWVIALVMVIFSNQLIGMFNISDSASRIAKYLLILHSILACIMWPICFVMPTSFRAAGDVRFSLILSVIVMWICRVGASIVFVKYMGLGVEGVWYAMFFDWIVRLPFLVVRYIRGTWLTKYKAV